MVQFQLYLLLYKNNLFSHLVSKNTTKKKWRYWRNFKLLLLNNNKKKNFIKLNRLYKEKCLIWHQVSNLYGSKIKNLTYIKNQIVFNSKFFYYLISIETRLNIIILRIRLFIKLLIVNYYIYKRRIVVNNTIKSYNYIIKIGDTIQYLPFTNIDLHKNNYKFFLWQKWNRLQWRKWKYYLKCNIYNLPLQNFFWLSSKCSIINYIELNYKVFSAVILRYPLLGEIILNKNKKLLSVFILKKIYFMY